MIDTLNPHEANFNLLRDQITRYVGYIDGWVDRWACDEESEEAIRSALFVIEQAAGKAKFVPPIKEDEPCCVCRVDSMKRS